MLRCDRKEQVGAPSKQAKVERSAIIVAELEFKIRVAADFTVTTRVQQTQSASRDMLGGRSNTPNRSERQFQITAWPHPSSPSFMQHISKYCTLSVGVPDDM